MGCRISKSYLTIIESSSNSDMSGQTIELVKDANDLIYFLKGDNHSDYKCIFIFGGYGSNKGEFIFELLNDNMKRAEKIGNNYGIHYIYLDIEELIIRNIRKRVKQLTGSSSQDEDDEDGGKQNDSSENNQGTEDQSMNQSNNQDEINSQAEKLNIDSPKSEITTTKSHRLSIKSSFNDSMDDGRWDDVGFLKKYFSELGNVVTNNWIRQLIEKEIEKYESKDQCSTKFIINLVPNRINLFRDCLYLKQGPNFSHFDYEFIAVNLIGVDQTKKDLDLINDSYSYKDANDYFVDYFRSINKLYEVKIKSKSAEPRVRLTRSPNAIKVKNTVQLEQLLKSKVSSDAFELDISEFADSFDRKGSLVFLIDSTIDTGQEIIAIDQSETNYKAIRNFVHFYCQIKDKLQIE